MYISATLIQKRNDVFMSNFIMNIFVYNYFCRKSDTFQYNGIKLKKRPKKQKPIAQIYWVIIGIITNIRGSEMVH